MILHLLILTGLHGFPNKYTLYFSIHDHPQIVIKKSLKNTEISSPIIRLKPDLTPHYKQQPLSKIPHLQSLCCTLCLPVSQFLSYSVTLSFPVRCSPPSGVNTISVTHYGDSHILLRLLTLYM